MIAFIAPNKTLARRSAFSNKEPQKFQTVYLTNKEDDQRFSNLPERYENQEPTRLAEFRYPVPFKNRNDPEQSTIRYLKTKRKGK